MLKYFGQLALACVLALTAVVAHAADRVALVISVSGYTKIARLPNPGADAKLTAATLRKAGFVVTEVADPDRTQMLNQLNAFSRVAAQADAAIIYYAGHGVEIDGKGYLLPKDIETGSKQQVLQFAVAASFAAESAKGARSVRLLVLDACRDNPFAREWSDGRSAIVTRGLPREELDGDVVLLLSAQAGKKAADAAPGDPRAAANSPFARAFTTAIQTPGLRIASLPTRLYQQMRAVDKLEQRPDQQGIWGDADWMFTTGTGAPPPPVVVPVNYTPAPAPPPRERRETLPERVDRLGLVVRRSADFDGIVVASVLPGTPATGAMFPGDVILKINGAAPDAGRTPGEAFADALAAKGRAQLIVQRGPSAITVVLRP